MALVALSVVLIALPNMATVYSAFIGRTGWPFTFILDDGWSGKTSLVIHGLVLNLAVWAGIVLGVWFGTARYTEPKGARREDRTTLQDRAHPAVQTDATDHGNGRDDG